MKVACFHLMAGILGISACFVVLAQTMAEIKRDPFERAGAAGAVSTSNASDVTTGPAVTSQSPGPLTAVKEWRPVPQAIIAGGVRPTVYVAGQMMVVGDVMQGYELSEVREHEAVFVYRGKTQIIKLGAQTQ